jgi:uncharacterized membrane protein
MRITLFNKNMKTRVKNDKGVAGLTIFLSLITMLFVIGLIVMIFSLMGGEMRDATYDSTAVAVTGENVLNAGLIAGSDLSDTSVGYTHATCSIDSVANETADGTVLTAGNYTLTTCALANATELTGTGWFVNYTVTYDASNDATNVMNDTVEGISGVTNWFAIFIVIGAMVVLILLTVIIISAIRSSGLIDTGSA